MNNSSKKTEKIAVNKIEDYINRIDNMNCSIKVDDTGISWDGEIHLYDGNIDKKTNYVCAIKTQVKGRKVKLKRLPDKQKFELDKSDLENYLKEDGTLFLAFLYKSIDEFKIYYAKLLPYDLRYYLKQKTNAKNKIKIKIKEVTDHKHLEKIIRDFIIDQKEQKKISDIVFNLDEVSMIKDGGEYRICYWTNDNYNITSILGEEKYCYKYDELNNIIGITCSEVSAISEKVKMNITNKKGEVFYSTVNHTITKQDNKLYFGNGFELDYEHRKFNLKLQGKLSNRLKQIDLANSILEENGFMINEDFLPLSLTPSDVEIFKQQSEVYSKIKDFMNKHKITKDLDLDKWEEKDFNYLLIWISAIDEHKPIKIEGFEISSIGSIQIKDLRFSIFAEQREDKAFDVYSIWNTEIKEKNIFLQDNGDKRIETNNWFMILNKEAYASDDININEMKNLFQNYELLQDEEILLNLQVLEIIKAYDYNKNEELLEYAMFILEMIETYESVCDVVYINKMQINKRKNNLTDEMIKELISIKNKQENMFYKIAVNLLIDNTLEANFQFSQLNPQEQEIFKKFPISKFFNNK